MVRINRMKIGSLYDIMEGGSLLLHSQTANQIYVPMIGLNDESIEYYPPLIETKAQIAVREAICDMNTDLLFKVCERWVIGEDKSIKLQTVE